MAAIVAPRRYQTKPLEQHLRCLREHRAICEGEAERLTADISVAQTDGKPFRYERLFKLHQSRLALRQQANACRDAICPISWVPNEVLCEVFTRCLPLDHRFSRTVAPILPLRVCQLWHSIAVSTGSLWSCMAFWTPLSSTTATCYPFRSVGGWLAHSGRSPLDIFLLQDLDYDHTKFVAEVVLLGHYSQCRHLDIHVTDASAPALINFVTLPPGSLASLESLVLEGLDESDFPAQYPEPTITAFQNSPRLRKLTTNALDFAFDINPDTSYADFDLLFLPWARLTHLMITDFITADTFIVALSECVGLEFLRVSVDFGDEGNYIDMDQWLPDEPVVLRNLTELHISISDGICIPPKLDSLAFPALQSLRFRRSESEEFDTSASFSWEHSPHFLRQMCNLRCLSLVGRVGAAEEIIVLLQSTPLVTDLNLDIPVDYQLLIPALFPPLCPDTSNTMLAGPLHALAHLSLRLGKADFPFPILCIRTTVDVLWPNCPLASLTIVAHRAFHRRLKKICSQLSFTPLQTVIGTLASHINNSTRSHTDEHLIDCERTNRHYTMTDPLTPLLNLVV